ncbi:hypothetical protein TNCV_1246021 [Trichonephila clavipes]|uniref:Uncharacterized protein n=1 Tax=Trichonephila clavipes TaxID=2585209 RepID=A0A8X6V0Z2_TRICX|nr:hypothetical protein TNCV_1246021 [Trichonephila clavipes]
MKKRSVGLCILLPRNMMIYDSSVWPQGKRKIWTADNSCGRSIVHLKKKSNKSVFLLEESENTKKGCQADSHQRDYVTGETRRDNAIQNM